MEQQEASLYNQAITLAKMGHREQAYTYFRRLAQINPKNLDIVLWLMYTAPSLEMTQAMLDRAVFIDAKNSAVQEADQWLTNEKLNLPQPAQGFKYFPPANTQTQIVPPYTTRPGNPYSYYPAQTQTSMPPYQNPPAVPYYPPPPALPAPYQPYQALPPAPYNQYPQAQLAPYNPYPQFQAGAYNAAPPAPYYPPYQQYQAPAPAYAPYVQPQPYYPTPQSYMQQYNEGRQNYVRPYYQHYDHYNQPPVYYPPVRRDTAQSPSYAYNNILSMGRNYRCPHCNTPYPPTNNRRISTSGWVTFGVFAAIFFPLCWVGLLMQENYLRCSHCHLTLT